MCERCVPLIAEVSRKTGRPEDAVVSALWEHTAYPFSDFETSARQLHEWADAVVASGSHPDDIPRPAAD